jgi:predicted AAA+ superfamily ATPase
VHALLNIANVDELQGHPVAGPSWEGFVIEQIAAHAPPGAELGFYRTAAGNELDAVLSVGQRRIGFEIKFSSAPKVGKGFWQALKDLGLQQAHIVAPVTRRYPLADGVEVIPVADIPAVLGGPAATPA